MKGAYHSLLHTGVFCLFFVQIVDAFAPERGIFRSRGGHPFFGQPVCKEDGEFFRAGAIEVQMVIPVRRAVDADLLCRIRPVQHLCARERIQIGDQPCPLRFGDG